MVLVIDNYSSFTYNLAQILGELGAAPVICRSDAITLDAIRSLAPGHIVISPGPGYPAAAGVAVDAIRELHTHIPILGVSQGHQCIVTAFGGQVEPAPRLLHGQACPVYHYGQGLFDGVPSPFSAACYHSLIACEPLPDALQVTGFTGEGEVMAVQHKTAPVVGVQFHPESVLTEHGKQIVQNFLVRYRG